MKLKYLFLITTFFLLFFCSYNVNAQSINDDIVIFDFEYGIVKPFNDYYIISGNDFVVLNNAKIISINYSANGKTIYDDRTITQFIQLPVIDGARLVIKNKTGIEIFNSTILERNFSNLWQYGLGRGFNNDLIIAPISVSFGIMTAGTQLLYHFRRKK